MLNSPVSLLRPPAFGGNKEACAGSRSLQARALRVLQPGAGCKGFTQLGLQQQCPNQVAQRGPRLISCAYGEVAGSSPAPAGCLGLPEDIERFYLFGQILGQGAYGTVRYGVNKHSNMECAVKVLPKQRNGNPATSRTLRKLEREIQVHSVLQDCGSVVSLYDAYEDEHNVYLVLEYCRGKTLEQHLLDDGPLSERQAALVLYEVLKVVATCHANSILHGDVKAANFVFARKAAGRSLEEVAANSTGAWLKAIDFGCSQRFRPGHPFQMRVGTPVFMAPEVFLRDYGLQADLWSVGILAYQLIAARFPFWDTLDECRSRTLDEVMKSVIVDEIDYSYGPWRSMSAAGLDLIQRLLTRDPLQRVSATEALRHPWFAEQGISTLQPAAPAVPAPLQQHTSNIVPLGAPATAAAPAPAAAPAADSGKLVIG